MDGSLEVCPACNSAFKIQYYQRRAADEPPDKVAYCGNCPLNTSKLASSLDSNAFKTSNIERSREVSKAKPWIRSSSKGSGHKRNSVSASSYHQSQLYNGSIVKFHGSTAARCLDNVSKSGTISKAVLGQRVSASRGGVSRVATSYASGPLSGSTVRDLDSATVGPFIVVQQIELSQNTENAIQNLSPTFLETYRNVSLDDSTIVCFVSSQHGEKEPCISVLLKHTKHEDISRTHLKIVQSVLSKYGTENSIKSFVDSRTISALYTQSARAFDSLSAPPSGYSYTWKPDGERYWCIKYGSVWLFCKRLLSARIVGWKIHNTLCKSEKPGPVLDLEVMIGHDPILIDVLMTESGSLTYAMRDLDGILEAFRKLPPMPFNIHVRAYFPTDKDLVQTRDSLTYPIDGIVGIENGTTTIIKIKDVKSIELKLEAEGNLCASDNTVVAASMLHNTYDVGSIIELRFKYNIKTKELQVLETLLRTDKTKANDLNVCKEIILLAGSLPDSVARRKALLWCASIRQELHSIAFNIRGRGRVIMDIGAGDGQAVSDYNKAKDTTYFLIEPQSAKCAALIKRLSRSAASRVEYITEATQVWKHLSLLSKGSIKYLVYQGRVEDILSQPRSISMLKTCIKCCVASYSISHTSSSLTQLALEGIEVLGCGYLYDNADKKGYIVNSSGVCMKKGDSTEASVKWGSDKEYSENAITSGTFKDSMSVLKASSIVSVSAAERDSLLTSIASSLYIVSTRKNL